MLRVKNGGCIRMLARRSLRASRARNLVAAAAIALTTVLFTSLFTITLSINDGFQQSNFRQCGGWSQGTFKYLTREQYEDLQGDPLIREGGLRRFLGMPAEAPFQKSHVEVGYSDEQQAHWMYCDPVEGHLPQEGTDQAATDTRVLSLLGVEPKIGERFTLTFFVDGHETTQSFTLCGWWEYDEAIVASHVLLPESRVEAVLKETGVTPETAADGMTGSWNLDVMFKSSLHIEREMQRVLENHGYQTESRAAGDNYIAAGVNWGYTGSRLTENLDPSTAAALAALLALIGLTGCLIIYNVFQISVTNDVRFYGLLKTIGTTPRQLRRILRYQALALSALGIPVGLALGWAVGGALTPVVVSRLSGVVSVVSARPVIFAGSALFSLGTVLLSCLRPGRLAGKVSPMEALRCTEGGGGGRGEKKSTGIVSPRSMAWANLGRSRSKTAVTVVSLSLAVVLVNLTVTFANGFDMDKYLAHFAASDFVLADAGYFQPGGELFSADSALTEEEIAAVTAQGGVADGGRVYGRTSIVEEFVTEDYFRAMHGRWSDAQALDQLVANTERAGDGLLSEDAQLFGMEPFALSRLKVLEGDLSALDAPGGRSIAAVYSDDDYGNPEPDSHWAKLGDTVTLRYVEEYRYADPVTGKPVDPASDENYILEATRYRDVDYTVAALVAVPFSLSYRYYGSDEYVLSDRAFVRDTGTDSVMLYAFDTGQGADAAMETFLKKETEQRGSRLDYESKATYASEFESFRAMFLLLGGALSFIVGLVGVLNFFNAVLTGILARRRELAMLQSIGMTGRQLRTMLVWEGLLYALGAAALALALSCALEPLLSASLGGVFWFFTYRFTVWPILLAVPWFALLGWAVPLGVERASSKATLVERLGRPE